MKEYQIYFRVIPLWVTMIFFINPLWSQSKTADAGIADYPVRFLSATDSATSLPSFRASSYILPGALVTYGLISLHSDALQDFDIKMQEKFSAPGHHTNVDDYLQFAPAFTVYALNVLGVKGKHNLMDRTGLYVLSNVIQIAMVHPMKEWTQKVRPDSSDNHSFPSGHTATAFVSAEFMRLEYKDVSPWYGVAGYAMATATGYLRMYNNKHWFSDVVAGAGIGIASTRLAYWLYPRIKNMFTRKKELHTTVYPLYQDGQYGFGLLYQFN